MRRKPLAITCSLLVAVTLLLPVLLPGAFSNNAKALEEPLFQLREEHQCNGDVINRFRNNLDVVLISDPMILRDGGNYYLYCTSEAAVAYGFEVWQSVDMVNWRYKGVCFQKTASTWSQDNFWAPECVKAGDIYYLYYSASNTGSKRICVASSPSPLGPFTEVAAPLFDNGSSDIDAHLFKDTDGKMYMYFAREVWNPLAENQIFVVGMDSYTSTEGECIFCIKATQSWEKKSYAGIIKWNEAPWVVKMDGTYYLMYSANCYDDSNYAVGYATSDSPGGPWTKYGDNPILEKTDDVSGPGHHCIVDAPDGRMWIGYHSHTGSGGAERQLNIDRINWSGGVVSVNGPTVRTQPYPANGFVLSGSSDDFSNPVLDPEWLVVSEDPSMWSLAARPGFLVITTEPGEVAEGAHDYNNIFLQHAPEGDFIISSWVTMSETADSEKAAIYIWQDDDNYIRMGMENSKLGWTCEGDGSCSTQLVDNPVGDTVRLAIRKDGETYRCMYWDNGWVQIYPDIAASFDPIKIGIAAMSTGSENSTKAYFDDFVLERFTTPVLSTLSPASGLVGDTVTISGCSLGSSQGSSYVTFNGTKALSCPTWSDTEVQVRVPSGATSGQVKVTTGYGTSNGKPFTLNTPTWYLAEGSSDWGFDTYVTIVNPNSTPVTAMVTYMTGEGPITRADVALPAMSQTTINPREDLGSTDFSTRVECKEGKTIAVDRRMLWTGPGALSQEGHSSIGVTAPEKTWYLAEGSSKWGFEAWLLIGNPNPEEATCTVTYMIEGDAPQAFEKKVPANSRASFNMETDIGARDASIKVQADRPVIPERAMYRNNRREGHDSIGTTTLANDFYLAEGTTDWGFTTYLLVQNPGGEPADVTVTYMTPSGPQQQPAFQMDPSSRKTICVNDVLPGTDLSTHVHGSVPIIAERAMYWDSGTGEACHDSIGMSSPHTTFHLPDGETYNDHETWTLVMNPNDSDVTVEISYLTPDGTGNVSFTDTVPANSRKTYNMGDAIPQGRAAVVVTSRTAGKKIMVERAMYWNSRGAGTDTIGGYSD